MRVALRQFAPPPEVAPAQEILEDQACRLWKGLPFAWREELERWKQHSLKVGQVLTVEGLTLWMERVQAGQCPIAGKGCSPPIPVSRFCLMHHERLKG